MFFCKFYEFFQKCLWCFYLLCEGLFNHQRTSVVRFLLWVLSNICDVFTYSVRNFSMSFQSDVSFHVLWVLSKMSVVVFLPCEWLFNVIRNWGFLWCFPVSSASFFKNVCGVFLYCEELFNIIHDWDFLWCSSTSFASSSKNVCGVFTYCVRNLSKSFTTEVFFDVFLWVLRVLSKMSVVFSLTPWGLFNIIHNWVFLWCCSVIFQQILT